MSKLLLRLLSAFFHPGIEDGQEDLQLDLDDGNGSENDPPNNDGEADNGDDGQDRGEQPDHAKLYAEEKSARETEKTRADKFERELADLRANQPRQPDPTVTDEDRRLADPNVTDLEKWQIRANRELRAGRMDSQAALAQAQDIADRTAFSQKVANNAAARKLEARVEEELQKMRAKGQSAPREAIYYFLLGRDSDAAITKRGSEKKPAKQDNQNVNRGRLPGARSDMNGKNSLSEHEKRRARLENQQI